MPWQQIAKRTVQDVTQTSTGWTFTYAIDSVGGLASVSSPAAGTALYNGIDALVNDESGPTIRRYNYTSGGSVDATAQPVAGISAVDYAGYPSLVTTESDGKIRRYNFYTGGNNDISVAPQAAISSMLLCVPLWGCHLRIRWQHPAVQFYHWRKQRRRHYSSFPDQHHSICGFL